MRRALLVAVVVVVMVVAFSLVYINNHRGPLPPCENQTSRCI
jgi:hypothetical protein